VGDQRAPFALAAAHPSSTLFIARDALGICPLYYAHGSGGEFTFASEVKAVLEVSATVREFPPGHWFTPETGLQGFVDARFPEGLSHDNDEIARGLRMRLESAICQQIDRDEMGSWLSGGLDSSAIAALARPHVRTLHTFAAGLPGAPDLHFAQQMAEHLNTTHHPVIVTLDQSLNVLPEVIYHLESFDALLVRSSITNYLVGEVAADYTQVSFSGEGADELFAGYAYLEQLPSDALAGELTEITRRLHNTALQRVDRSAAAHGLVVHVPFLDPQVVEYAERIPVQLKLQQGDEGIEKWILRRALVGVLPDSVLWRRKAKFWQGTGLGEQISEYAEGRISDAEFRRERRLPNGWTLNSKEELLYYRIFEGHFGRLESLDWMGRSRTRRSTRTSAS